MGLFDSHAGSWGGLPDFGITEGIGNLLGAGQTAQGGSNLTNSVGTYPTAISPQGQSIQGPGLGWYGDVSKSGGNVWQDPSRPAVLGASTQAPGSGSSGGGGGGGGTGIIRNNGGAGDGMTAEQYQADQAYRAQQLADQQNQIRNGISSGWDNYIGSLNDIGNTYLPQQMQSQQDIANSQYTQGQNAINSQKATSLKDIANNIRNAFQAGNIYLGSRGAGDSSAANQYSFAINQEANKQTSNLNDFVNTQLNSLSATHDQQLAQIAQWFSQAQQQIKQQAASGQLGKSQDLQNYSQNILNQAIQAANQVKSDTSARYNALVTWAANNSQNLGQLQQNIKGVAQSFGTPMIDQTTGSTTPVGFGFGQTTNDKNNLFG